MNSILLLIVGTLAAIVSIEALTSPTNGGCVYALPIVGALALLHAWLLRGKTSVAGIAEGTRRRWGWLVAGILLLVCAETLVRQIIAVSAQPFSLRGGAQLGALAQTAERMRSGEVVYPNPIPMAGYETYPSAMPALTLPIRAVRANALDWRMATLLAEATAVAIAIGAVIALTLRGAPLSVIAGVALGLGGFLLAPKLEGFAQWGSSAPLWPLVGGLGVALASRKSWIVAVLAGVLASMSIGWLMLFPVVAAVLWRVERERAAVPLVVAAMIPAVAILTFRDEMFPMFSHILGVPFLRADPQSAGEIEPWLFPSLSGAATAMKMGPPLFAWVVIFIIYTVRRIVREDTDERAIERFALVAFIVVACGPATFSFDYYSHVILLGGLLFARWIWCAKPTPSAPARDVLIPWVTAIAACAILLLPVAYKVRKGNALALDRRESGTQPPGELRMSGWLEPDVDGRVMSDGRFAEVAFHLRRARPCAIEVDLEVPGGTYTPYNPITVRLNGRNCGEWIALPGERFICRINVDDPAMLVRGVNVIAIEATWARSMKSLGIWNDARPTAFRYGGLKFQKLD